jgi:hypothetical protein
MCCAASATDASGSTVTTERVINALTGVASRSSPRATAFMMSRSVMMPRSSASFITTSEPVCCFHIRPAASRSVAAADSVMLARFMTSETCTVTD